MLVAPRVGAWIENRSYDPLGRCRRVAPRVGAWIEKQDIINRDIAKAVAPRVGAWIENAIGPLDKSIESSRSSRRSVD